MKNFFRKLPVNIFSLLVAIMAIAFAGRAVDIALHGGESPAVPSARAQKQVSEQPPPLSQADIEKAIRDTARAAEALPDTPAQTATAPAEQPAEAAPSASSAGNPAYDDEQRAFSTDEIEVLQSLARRREEIEKREQKLAAQEALLKAAEQEVDRKIAELNKLRSELESLLGQQQTMEDDRIASLVKIYENMKPKEAAAIFNTLDMDVLLAVISKMAERRSSPIIANMDTDRARLVTIRLAEQRKLPGDNKKPAAGAR